MKVNRLFIIFAFFLINNCYGEIYLGILGGGSGGGDFNHSKIRNEIGCYAGGVIGSNSFRILRLEEEILYQKSKIYFHSHPFFASHHKKGDVKLWTFMTNALIDFHLPFVISPYLGGGIGYFSREKHIPFIDAKLRENGFAWQAIIGIKYFACLGLELGLDYRYLKIEDQKAFHRLGLKLVKFF